MRNPLKKEGGHEGCLTVVSEDRLLAIDIRFDGCFHIRNWNNGYSQDNRPDLNSEAGWNESYIHICEAEEFIQQLQQAVDEAKKHFGPDWPN